MNDRDLPEAKPTEPTERLESPTVELTDSELEPVSGGAGRTRRGTPDDSI